MNYKVIEIKEWDIQMPYIGYNQLIYLEKQPHKAINSYLLRHFNQINDRTLKNGVAFIFFPGLKENISSLNDLLAEAVQYNHPEWIGNSWELYIEKLLLAIPSIDSKIYYDIIYREILHHDINDNALLIRRLNDQNLIVWSCNLGSGSSSMEIADDCFLSQGELVDKIYPVYEDIADNPTEYNADLQFEERGNDIAHEIKARIDLLGKNGLYGSLIDILLYTAKECGVDVKLDRKLINRDKEFTNELTLLDGARPQNRLGVRFKPKPFKWDNEVSISPVVVTEKFEILLPLYNDMEIKLTPLPKALYILFLRHPDGILFKYLVDHQTELVTIYNRLTGRTEQTLIDDSIKALVDVTNNSVNEKCSRIKEAFLRVMDDSIAENYYITGARGYVKRIKLSPLKVNVVASFDKF